jgi:hypothetical protein
VKHHDNKTEKKAEEEPVKQLVKELTAQEKALARRATLKRELEEKKRQGVK